MEESIKRAMGLTDDELENVVNAFLEFGEAAKEWKGCFTPNLSALLSSTGADHCDDDRNSWLP